jgi:hypothetical protein
VLCILLTGDSLAFIFVLELLLVSSMHVLSMNETCGRDGTVPEAEWTMKGMHITVLLGMKIYG